MFVTDRREGIAALVFLGLCVPFGLSLAGASPADTAGKTVIVAAVSVFVFSYVRVSESNIERLVRTQEDLVRASRAKDQFLATISHEIRTPLNGVIGIAQLIQLSVKDPEQREHIDTLTASANHLHRLINTLLDFSKLRADRIKLTLEPVDIRALVREVVQAHRVEPAGPTVEGAEGPVPLKIKLDDSLPARIVGDRTRLAQILHNLVSNAVKFTGDGQVVVACTYGDGHLHCSVKDSGPGIPEDAVTYLFEPFRQVDQSSTRKAGGTGLGLAICKELVDRMDGEIDVDTKLGLGSRFWVRIPLEVAKPPPEDQASAGRTSDEPATERAARSRPLADATEQSVPTHHQPSIPADAPRVAEPESSPNPRSTKGAAGGHDGKRILVVDDNAVNRLVSRRMTNRLGFSVDLAEDGKQAVERALEQVYVAILMDCEMPVMDGFEATREIRRVTGANQRTPIIAVTAHALEGARERCMDVGMDAFLTKPVDLNQLKSTIDQLCAAPASTGDIT